MGWEVERERERVRERERRERLILLMVAHNVNNYYWRKDAIKSKAERVAQLINHFCERRNKQRKQEECLNWRGCLQPQLLIIQVLLLLIQSRLQCTTWVHTLPQLQEISSTISSRAVTKNSTVASSKNV